MITRADAIAQVESQLNQFDPDWPTRPKRIVVDSLTIEKDWGWVLFYGVSEDFQLGHEGELPGENPPFIVDKRTARLVIAGSDGPLAYYVERFEQSRES